MQIVISSQLPHSSLARCCSCLTPSADLQALNIKGSDSYYDQSSSFQYIPKIRTPCLFTLALNDTFIKYVYRSCYPSFCIPMPADTNTACHASTWLRNIKLLEQQP